MKRDSILVIDDVEVNRLLLEEIFKKTYKVINASNGQEGIDLLESFHSEIAAIMLDIGMPVMDGFEFLEKVSAMTEAEGIPIIIVSTDDTSNSQLKALDYGVMDVIRKPYNPKIICKRVNNAIALFEYRNRLEEMCEEKTVELERKQKVLNKVNEELLEALSSVVEFRDVETGGHIKRIKEYTDILSIQVMRDRPDAGINIHNQPLIVAASAMHDIGKIGIPDAILLKPARLTPEEYEVIKSHTTKGATLLDKVPLINDSEYLKYCRDICLYHHEKYDGNGYPEGLKGDAIPIWSQIVSIVDVFDALVSKRVYKEEYSFEETFNMIVNGECGKFSDDLISSFKKVYEKFKLVALRTKVA